VAQFSPTWYCTSTASIQCVSLYPVCACNSVFVHHPINGTHRVRSCYPLTITSGSLCLVSQPDDESCHDLWPGAVGCYVGGFVSVSVWMSAVVCLSPLQTDFHGSLGPLIELGGTIHPHPFLIKLLMTPHSPVGGYLQLQNPLSGDSSECPVCLAHPSFVIRNSVINVFQSVIKHDAIMKRGVVEV